MKKKKTEENPSYSEYDKLWLQEVYKTILENKRPSYRVVRAKLYNSLPKNYDPELMDPRLSRFHGEEIMIMGVDLVDPDLKVFDKANAVINSIRAIVLNDPEKKLVEVPEIVDKTGLDAKTVSLILRLIYPYGRFWYSASGSQDFQYGYSAINIEHGNDIFDSYLYHKDIRDLVRIYNLKAQTESKGAQSDERAEIASIDHQLSPIFKSRISVIDTKLCFVLMPFKEEWSDEVFLIIRDTVESMGLQCLRADNLNGPIIIEDIWAKINQAAFIIADVTNRNANVMYEVGIAHTVGRPTILLTQDVKQAPFDLTHLRHLEYKNSVGGSELLRSKLLEAVQGLYKQDLKGIKLSVSKPLKTRFKQTSSKRKK